MDDRPIKTAPSRPSPFIVSGERNIIPFDRPEGRFAGAACNIQGDDNVVDFADDVRFPKSKVAIRGSRNRIIVGKGCSFDMSRLIIYGNDCEIVIGYNSHTNMGTFLTVKEDKMSIRIGNDCLFSTDISIKTSDNHGIFSAETYERINPPASVEIADRVWLGENVKVLKGVRIGSDTIVGAASVVTKSLGSNIIAVGTPAKPIRDKVFWWKHTTLPPGFREAREKRLAETAAADPQVPQQGLPI